MNKLSALGVSVGLLVCVQAPAVQAHDDWLDDCRQTVLDYAYYRDRPDASGVANLFTEQGSFKIGSDVFQGREAISSRVAAGGPVFRHMMSTIKIQAVSESKATGVSYAAVYSGVSDTLPVTVTSFLAIGEYHDEFTRQGNSCRISRREFVSVMLPKAE